jgi:hypothetical protein
VSEANQPEAPPAYFEQLRAELGQFAQGVAGELNAIKQQVAQGRAPQQPAAPPPPEPPADIDQRLVDEFVRNPRRQYAEVIAIAEQRAVEKMEKKLGEQRQAEMQQAQWQGFWQSFYQHPENADLVPFHEQLVAGFYRNGHINDISGRANAARDEMRAILAQREQAAIQSAQRQQQGARRAAGGPGSQALPPQAYDPTPRDDSERIHPKDALMEAMAEAQASRAKKEWNKIATPEYERSSRDRGLRTVPARRSA